ncbi:MAG: sulfotransferase [Candidatus Thiodiazotropha sp.]
MRVTESEIQTTIFQVLTDIIEEWGDELDEPLNPDTKLVDDIGFSSIDFVQFAVAVESRFQTKLGFQALLMKNGGYVDDLSAQQVSNFVFERLNQDEDSAKTDSEMPVQSHSRVESVDDKVTAEAFDEFCRIIRPSKKLPISPQKNPPAVFILSPPRSGSTLLRIMLAGSPQLFVPPELHLLSYGDMAERRSILDDEHNSHLLEGTIRALMQLRNWDAEQAREFASNSESDAMSCIDFYSLLQSDIGDRLLVDKTPTYAINTLILDRAEAHFENAKYIHLLRHPCGTIRSYEESKLTRMMPLMNESDFSSRMLAEMTWLLFHRNILEFFEKVPSQRIHQLKYEELLQHPETEMRKICDFLSVEFNSDMLDPYQDHKHRMADGVDTASKMSGDIKFHLHEGINTDAAFRWKQFYSETILGHITANTARQLGYSI